MKDWTVDHYIAYGAGVLLSVGSIILMVLDPDPGLSLIQRVFGMLFGSLFLIALLLAKVLDRPAPWEKRSKEGKG